VSIIAASVDSLEDTQTVAAELGCPVAWGVTREQGDQIGAWWEERRDHIQPSEFILNREGRVAASVYSSAPVGRLDPRNTLDLITFLNQRASGKS